MAGFLAYILPIDQPSGGQPSHPIAPGGMPGQPTHPIAGAPIGPAHPIYDPNAPIATPPIYIPILPPEGVEPPEGSDISPEHPIYIPVYPAHPIVAPPEQPGQPPIVIWPPQVTHPIVYPPEVTHPIYLPKWEDIVSNLIGNLPTPPATAQPIKK